MTRHGYVYTALQARRPKLLGDSRKRDETRSMATPAITTDSGRRCSGDRKSHSGVEAASTWPGHSARSSSREHDVPRAEYRPFADDRLPSREHYARQRAFLSILSVRAESFIGVADISVLPLQSSFAEQWNSATSSEHALCAFLSVDFHVHDCVV